MLYGYSKRWWKGQFFSKYSETDEIDNTEIEIRITSGRNIQRKVHKFKNSYSGPPVIDTSTLNAIEKDKKSSRKAFEMINEEIEKIVCKMP